MNVSVSLSQRADALEAKMAQELDYLVIKSRLHSLAEGDTGAPPSAAAAPSAGASYSASLSCSQARRCRSSARLWTSSSCCSASVS